MGPGHGRFGDHWRPDRGPRQRDGRRGDVALIDGKIAAVGTGLGGAERVIDAAGLVVAPGFIDLHAHGRSIPADRMQAFEGVTTTLDLEAGVLPVASWYRRQASQGRVLNYGAAANWAFARIGAMTGSNEESSLEAFGRAMRDRRWMENAANEAEVTGMLDRIETGHRHRHPERVRARRGRPGADGGVQARGGA